jgi:chromosome segregation ATPase
VVAVAGALAPKMFGIGDSTKQADDATQTYGESLEEVNRIIDEANDKSATRAQRLRDEGQAALEGARKEVQAAEAKLEALRGGGTGLAGLLNDALDGGGASPSNPRLDRARRNGESSGLATFLEDTLGLNDGGSSAQPGLDPRSRRGLDRRIEAAQQELEKRSERLQDLREKLDKAISEGGDGSSTSEAGGGTADADRFGIPKQSTLDRLEEQVRLQEMSARERAQARAVMQAQNEAMKEGNLLAEQEIAQIRETAGTLSDLREGVRVQ